MATNLEDAYGYWLKDDEGYVRLASGTTVPTDATAGYAVGCLFQHTDGGANTALYVNEGTTASCDFNAINATGSASPFTITGIEANPGQLRLWADDGDDTADKWTVSALASATSFTITNASLTATTFTLASGALTITGEEAGNATLNLWADEGDDDADKWSLRSTASGNALDVGIATGTVFSLSSAGTLTLNGGMVSISPTAGVGYAAGAGGAQTQATDKSTGVTSNTITTAITMNAAALNAGVTVSFTFTNSAIAATDTVIVTHQSAGTSGAYTLNAFPGAGSAVISVRNNTAGNLAEAIVLRVTVIKSVSA